MGNNPPCASLLIAVHVTEVAASAVLVAKTSSVLLVATSTVLVAKTSAVLAATSAVLAATSTVLAATSTVLVILRMALVETRAQPVLVLVLLGTIGAIHEFARAFRLLRLVPAERIVVVMLGLREPTTQAGVFHISALATVMVFTAVNRAFESVDRIKENPKVAGGEVVAHALENVQDLVVGDVAIVV